MQTSHCMQDYANKISNSIHTKKKKIRLIHHCFYGSTHLLLLNKILLIEMYIHAFMYSYIFSLNFQKDVQLIKEYERIYSLLEKR